MKKGLVTEENKSLARYVAKAFGGAPHVVEFADDARPLAVDILSCEDQPDHGLTSYGTIGLSDTPMTWEKGIFPTRLELVGVCRAKEKAFPGILASAAFSIMATEELHAPGDVILNLVRDYVPKTTVPHLYVTAPYLWETSLTTKDLGSKKVAWLLVVPISDSELTFLKEHGEDAFEDRFAEEEVDIAYLLRKPVI